MDEYDSNEPPAKRMRRSQDARASEMTGLSIERIVKEARQLQSGDESLQKELAAGITTYINPGLAGFSGTLKQRYTDFLVNEMLPNGSVVHLETSALPESARGSTSNAKSHEGEAKPQDQDSAPNVSKSLTDTTNQDDVRESASAGERTDISVEAKALLASLFGDSIAKSLQELYQFCLENPDKKPRDVRPVKTGKIIDKEARKQAHQAIRQAFNSKLDSKTSDDDIIIVTAAPSGVKPRGGFEQTGAGIKNKRGWAELGGEYLHFTLYKENRDTMEAVSFLASQLKVPAKTLQFGGTKDRRAVTVQRVSAFRIKAEQLAAIGKNLKGAKVGDWKYLPHGIELGEIGGNEFCISLRDCRFSGDETMAADERLDFAKNTLSESVTRFQSEGFINYYGLQRFGSYTASTDQIGVKLLQGNLKGAVEDILSFSADALEASSDHSSTDKNGKLISRDDIARAHAIHTFITTPSSGERALSLLPKKFSAESNIIRKLSSGGTKSSSNDYQGALMAIPRTLRMMYVHAYQSLVWNHVAGARWSLYGRRVVAGDLVLVREHRDKEAGAAPPSTVDDAGEPIVLPAADDKAVTADDDAHERARALTEEEVASGKYSVFDIVLPLPGYDVLYPQNETAKAYKDFMASESGGGLDPLDMRRSWKDVSLSGGYRKLLARPVGEKVDFEVKKYKGLNTQLVETDLERLVKRGAETAGESRSDAGKGNGVGALDAGVQGAQQEENGFAQDEEERIAVILRLRLGSSTYATMALRELMKSGLHQFQPEYTGR